MDLSSRNGHSPGSATARTVEQAKPLTAYEVAIAAATDTEKERLKAIRLQFDIPPNSPEWGFYAVLAPLVATRTGSDKALEATGERLERLQQSVDDLKRHKPAATAARSEPADPLASLIRYFFAFTFGAVVCELVFAAVGYGWLSGPIFDRVGMFCLGLTAAAIVLLWLWLRPQLSTWGGRRDG